jgi:phosphate-selective porin OprO and OprP
MTTRAMVVAALMGLSPAVLAGQEAVANIPASPTTQSPATAAETKFVWREYPSIRSGRFRIDFRARFSADLRRSDSLADDVDEAGLDIARRRIGVAGSFGDIIEFQVEREIHNDVPWRDVYVDVRPKREIGVQAGKFKMPFSLDENTSSTNLDFIYRSMAASTLAPGRDRGVMAHGRVGGRRLGYEAGVFLHDGDNALANDPEEVRGDQTIALRLTIEPLTGRKSRADELRFGVAWTGTDVPEGMTAIGGDTALHSHFFPSNVWVRGARRRIGGELEWRPGPYSLKAEYIRMTQQRLGQSVTDGDLPDAISDGWYVSGTWAMTGEQKSRGLESPKRPLPGGGFGAVELAARLETLTFGSGAAAGEGTRSPRSDVLLRNRDQATTFGVNWYVNRWVKVQGNIIRESIEDPSRGPVPSRPVFWSRVLRFQVVL